MTRRPARTLLTGLVLVAVLVRVLRRSSTTPPRELVEAEADEVDVEADVFVYGW